MTNLPGHSGAVTRTAFAADGSFVLTTGLDGLVRIRHLGGEAAEQLVQGRVGPIRGLALAGDHVVIAGDGARTFRIGDPPGELFAAGAGPENLRATAIGLRSGIIVTGGIDPIVRVWDLFDFTPLKAFNGHSGTLTDIVLSSDESTIWTTSQDGTLGSWELSDLPPRKIGKVIREEVDIGNGCRCAILHGTEIPTSLTFDPTGTRLYATELAGSVRCWNLATGEQYATREHHRQVWSIVVAEEGLWGYSAGQDGTIRKWHLEALAQASCLTSQPSAFTCVAATPNDQELWAGNDDGRIYVLGTEPDRMRAVLSGHRGEVVSIVSDRRAGGVLIASADRAGNVLLWDRNSRRVLHHFQTVNRVGLFPAPIRQIALAPGARFLAAVDESSRVRVWDTTIGALRQNIRIEAPCLYSVCFLSNARFVAVGSGPQRQEPRGDQGRAVANTLRILDLHNPGVEFHLGGHVGAVEALSLAPDGRILASAGTDGTIRLWTLPDLYVAES